MPDTRRDRATHALAIRLSVTRHGDQGIVPGMPAAAHRAVRDPPAPPVDLRAARPCVA